MSEPIFIKCDRLLPKIEQDRFMHEIKKKMDDQPVILLPPYMDVVYPAQEWIPVSEKMPNGQELVIVSCHDTSGDGSFDYTSSGWTTTDGEYWIVDNEINHFVVAWMPLPEPYKAESEDKE